MSRADWEVPYFVSQYLAPDRQTPFDAKRDIDLCITMQGSYYKECQIYLYMFLF